MRKRILTTLAGLFFITASALSAVNGVRVGNGEKEVFFSFESQPEVSFSGSTIQITGGDRQIEYSMDTAVTFEFVDMTGVENVRTNFTHIRFNGDLIQISGLEGGTEVNVFDLSGRKIAGFKSDSDGNCEILKAQLPQEPMIFVTTKFAYKLINR